MEKMIIRVEGRGDDGEVVGGSRRQVGVCVRGKDEGESVVCVGG